MTWLSGAAARTGAFKKYEVNRLQEKDVWRIIKKVIGSMVMEC